MTEAVAETWCMHVRDEREARRLARDLEIDLRPGYSWEWRELPVPTGALGYGWFVHAVLGESKVKVGRSTYVLPEEQVMMRIETENFSKPEHAGLVIATTPDGGVFGYRKGSIPGPGQSFRRIAILHPVPNDIEFMDWVQREIAPRALPDVYAFHVQAPE